MRLAERCENWTIDDWIRVMFSDEAKRIRFNLYGMSWYWIGDGDRVGRQHVHQTVKHGVGSAML